MEIAPINLEGIKPLTLSRPTDRMEGARFSDSLQQALEEVNHLQLEADTTARDFVVGDVESIHDTMIAMEKADISLRLVTQVRNKVVEAYQEIMRMQV